MPALTISHPIAHAQDISSAAACREGTNQRLHCHLTSNQRAQDTLLLHNKVISQAVDQLKATFGGNPSEGERKILLDLAGSLNSPDSVRQKIYDDAIEYAQKRIEKNKRQAEGIRAGTYYTPGGGGTGSGSASGASDRKTIGGKNYSKIGGQWFED